MTAERWRHVKVLFESTRDATGEERDRVLGDTADADVAREVRLLLEAYDQSHDFLEDPALASHADILSAHVPPIEGQLAGSYRIKREIAEGGMGIVFEGFRSDGHFEQRVAIKVMKSWMMSEAEVARFRAERQIVADLNHPNIARLLDGGATSGGLPYFVMEFVDGLYLDEFCFKGDLPVEQRLQLFRTVCDAVHYAHTKGVIHRDLKPNNILVDSSGVPKLLDFGIAKVWRPDTPTTRTKTIGRVATPRYASPEQLRGEPVTPSTDIYSLGVVLYEVLTGTHPYRAANDAMHAMGTAICEQDPEKPSQRAGQKSWARDLDNIVLKAMQKAPADRYQTAAELSEAIGRFLDHRPSRVRVPRFSYQTRLRIRKLWRPIAAVILLALALAGWWLWRGGAERLTGRRRSLAVLGFQNLSSSGADAWIETALSEMLTTELASGERVRMVSGENVNQVKRDLNLAGASSYSREQLQRLRSSLNADYFLTGSFLSDTRNVAGLRIYLRLQDARTGQIVAATSEQGAASDLPALVYDAVDDLARRGDWGGMAPSRAGGGLHSFENPAGAKLYAEGLDRSRHFDPAGALDLFAKAVAADPKNPLAHSAYGAALDTLGYEEKAGAEAKLAYDLSASLPREQRLLVEARYHSSQHDWRAAIENYRTLWDLFHDNLEYGLRLAGAQNDGGQSKQALATIASLRTLLPAKAVDPRIALAEVRAAQLQADYPRMLNAAASASGDASRIGARSAQASAERYRGDALYELDRLDEALSAYRIAERICRDLGDTFGLASTFIRQGRVFWKRGDYDTNRDYNERALALFRQIGNKSAIPTVLNNLALSIRQKGDFEGALKLMEEAAAVEREVGDRQGLMYSLNNIGIILRRLNRPEQARRHHEECLAIAIQLNNRQQVARSYVTLASLDADEGNLLSAAERLAQALSSGGGSENLRMTILQHLGEVKRAQGDADGALKAYHESLDLSLKLKAEQYTADTKLSLSEMEAERKDFATARKLWSEATAYYSRQKLKTELWGAALSGARIRISAGGAGDESSREIEEAIAGYDSLKSPARATEAYAVLIEVKLAQHRPAEALAAVRRGRPASLQGHEYLPWMQYRLQAARTLAATGNAAAAARELRAILSDLESKGWSELASHARAALAELPGKPGLPR